MKTVVSEKGQITIPKAVRNQLGIGPGTILDIERSEGKIIAVKISPRDTLSKWRGKGKLPVGKNVDEYLQSIRG
jgi:antitoxin PrlF